MCRPLRSIVAVRDHAHDDLLGAAEHGVEELLAPLRRALLRVVQERERPHLVVAQTAVVEQDARDDERAGETAPSGLVGARDEPRAELPVELQELLAGRADATAAEDTELLGGLFGGVSAEYVRLAAGSAA